MALAAAGILTDRLVLDLGVDEVTLLLVAAALRKKEELNRKFDLYLRIQLRFDIRWTQYSNRTALS